MNALNQEFGGARRLARQAARGIALAAIGWAAAACANPNRQMKQAKVKDLNQVLVAVPDPEMRQRWRAAQAAGQLPPLATLPKPERPVSYRRHAKAPEAPGRREVKPIPREAVAGVRLAAPKELREYRGSFDVVRAAPGMLVGRLAEPPGELVVHYKLPGDARLAEIAAGQSMKLEFRDDVDEQSVRTVVDLYDDGRPIVFFYLSDGGGKPYERAFRNGLTVRQIEPAEGEARGAEAPPPKVEISYADQKVQLSPGERRRTRDAAGEIEVFALSSYRTPPELALTEEGDRYHVTLMIYRPDAPQ